MKVPPRAAALAAMHSYAWPGNVRELRNAVARAVVVAERDVITLGDLPERVTSTRKQMALELGFVMPTVRIRDSIQLRSSEYVIKVRGEEVGRSECQPTMLLAISSGAVIGSVGAGLAGVFR